MRNWLPTVLVLSAACAAFAADEWPCFRGPDGQGHAPASVTGVPVSWSESENVKWKMELPGQGWSSPVVSGNEIWMTTATDEGKSLRAVCVSFDGGKILHDVEVFHVDTPEKKHALNSYASPTPIIENGRLYVYFGTNGLACLSTKDASKLWEKRDLKHDIQNGAGSTPVLYKDLILICIDGMDIQYQIAINKKDGTVAWKTPRSMPVLKKEDMRKAYGTPLVYSVAGKDQMVAPAAEGFYAYDPLTGKELWRLKHPGFSNVPVPVFGNGMLYLDTGFGKAQMWGVKPAPGGGADLDLPPANVVFRINGLPPCPTQPSPLLVGERLYMLSDTGAVSCINALTGAVVWTEKLNGEYSSSPTLADGHIYIFNRLNKATVFDPGEKFAKVAENTLEDGCMASPAFVGKTMVLRTKTALYRIER